MHPYVTDIVDGLKTRGFVSLRDIITIRLKSVFFEKGFVLSRTKLKTYFAITIKI